MWRDGGLDIYNVIQYHSRATCRSTHVRSQVTQKQHACACSQLACACVCTRARCKSNTCVLPKLMRITLTVQSGSFFLVSVTTCSFYCVTSKLRIVQSCKCDRDLRVHCVCVCAYSRARVRVRVLASAVKFLVSGTVCSCTCM